MPRNKAALAASDLPPGEARQQHATTATNIKQRDQAEALVHLHADALLGQKDTPDLAERRTKRRGAESVLTARHGLPGRRVRRLAAQGPLRGAASPTSSRAPERVRSRSRW